MFVESFMKRNEENLTGSKIHTGDVVSQKSLSLKKRVGPRVVMSCFFDGVSSVVF